MHLSVSAILRLYPQSFTLISGDAEHFASRPWPAARAETGSLVFASTAADCRLAESNLAGILIATPQALSEFQPQRDSNQWSILRCSSIPNAMALLNSHFLFQPSNLGQDFANSSESPYPWAFVHPEAKLGPNVQIGAGTVVAKNAVLGEGTRLGPLCFVGETAVVGAYSVLESHVTVGHRCIIGSRCRIQSHTSIGSDGFGYYSDGKTPPLAIAQLGVVILGDGVELGSHVTVDRATLTETRIGSGTKIDNLCHIAHNCEIGANCLIAAGFMLAGSSRVGDGCVVAGSVVVGDHRTIGSGVTLGGRSAVTKDVLIPGAYTGHPLLPLKDGLRSIASIAELPQLRKQVKLLEEKIEQLTKSINK